MSYCREEGKDRIIFVTKEDHEIPSTATLPEDEEEPGLIMDNGDINWSCPCLGGMATGPCGYEFREAFSCFHYSEADPKGSDCYEQFATMQKCMSEYPALYDVDDKDDDKPDLSALEDKAQEDAEKSTSSSPAASEDTKQTENNDMKKS